MKNLFLLAGLLLLIPTISGCATVGPGEVGLKQEFGKVEPVLYESGLHNFNPLTQQFITQSIQKVTVDSQSDSNSLSHNASTIDQLPIDVRYSVIYYIPKNQVLPLYLGVKGDPFESLVAPRVNEALRTVIAQYRSDQVTAKSSEIQHKVAVLANELVGDSVTIVDVPITHIELPPEIVASVKAKQMMEVQSRQEQFKLDKQRIAAQITIVDANAKAQAIKVQADALKTSPELIKLKLAEVEMAKAEKWNGQLPNTVMSSGATPLFNLK